MSFHKNQLHNFCLNLEKSCKLYLCQRDRDRKTKWSSKSWKQELYTRKCMRRELFCAMHPYLTGKWLCLRMCLTIWVFLRDL